MSLAYSGSSSPDLCTVFSDADLGGNPDNSRSTGRFAICIGGVGVQWVSRLHVVVEYGVRVHNSLQGGLRGDVDEVITGRVWL